MSAATISTPSRSESVSFGAPPARASSREDAPHWPDRFLKRSSTT